MNKIATWLNNKGYNSTLSNNKKVKKEQLFYAQTVKKILGDQGIIDYGKTIKGRYLLSRNPKPTN